MPVERGTFPIEIVDDAAEQERIQFELPARPSVVWRPDDAVLQEYRWVREFVQTWNPMPAIRASYQAQGWAWWAMYAAVLGWMLGGGFWAMR